jgi:peptidyl-dipeptidase Dcp
MLQQFFSLSPLKYHAIDYDKLPVKDYLPALDEAIALAQNKLIAWKQNTHLSFKEVIIGFESISDEVGMIANLFHNMHVAHSTPELQEIAEKFSNTLTKFQLTLTLDSEIFKKIHDFYQIKDQQKLNAEEKMILEKIHKDFVRNGALLNPDDKKKLEAIDEQLASLQLKFSENLLKATKSFELHITNQEELVGIPESALMVAQNEAKKRNKSGWVFTLDFGSYISVMKYAQKSPVRENIFRAYATKATSGELSNKPLIKKILELRLDRAKLLGYSSYASYILEMRMAKDVPTVKNFSNELYEKAYLKAKKEFEELKEYAESKGASDLKKWDVAYYSERLKEERYSYNEEEVKPYFPIQQVLEGIFSLANQLYDLNFKKTTAFPTYAQDIDVYEVFDKNQNFVALLYLDFFSRETKKQGAWMTAYIEQGYQFAKNLRPHIGIVCNFTKSVGAEPTLLTWNDVITLFHEFGHALHGMLSECQYKYLSGTNVYWDFVELPSQIMENWAKQQDCLKTFAKHYKNGSMLPLELMNKIIAADKFQSGLMTLRQLSFGMLDLIYHEQISPEPFEDCDVFERNVMKNYSFLPPLEGESLSCGYSHIFSGGYAAGYYSYKWAEVLDADAFSAFKEKGLFNKELAKSFKENILSRGGTEDPAKLFEKFRGRPPKIDALIERLGLNG